MWFCNMVTSGSRSEILTKFRNVVLEKEGEVHVDGWHEN
jgi:hypothetical protein